MVNLTQTDGWRVVDVAHHELRWSDLLLLAERGVSPAVDSNTSSDTSHTHLSEIPQRFEVSRAPLYELTELCELACSSRGQTHTMSAQAEHIIDSVVEYATTPETSQITPFAMSARALGGAPSIERVNRRDPHAKQRSEMSSWRVLQRLEGSRDLGLFEQCIRRGVTLWVHTPRGESRPHTLWSEHLTRHLTPEVVIGERAAPPLMKGLLWVRDPGRGALFNATLNRLLAELPFAQGGSIGAHFATLIGVHKPEITQRVAHTDERAMHEEGANEERPQREKNAATQARLTDGIWGILDLGVSACSWSLIEVDRSLGPHQVQLYELSTEGCEGVGERSLFRALLNDELVTRGQLWEEVSQADRRRWIDYIQAQVDELIYAAWPDHLKAKITPPQHASSVTSSSALKVARQVRHLLYSEVSTWIERSFRRHELGPEALRGVWVTGRMGGALLQQLKSSLPTVNVKLAQADAAMLGAQSYLRALKTPGAVMYELTEVARRALILCGEDGSAQLLIPEGETLPTVVDVLVQPGSGHLSLAARAEHGSLVVLAEHPPLDQPRRLMISYEGPYLFCLEWLDPDRPSGDSTRDDSIRLESLTDNVPESQWSFR